MVSKATQTDYINILEDGPVDGECWASQDDKEDENLIKEVDTLSAIERARPQVKFLKDPAEFQRAREEASFCSKEMRRLQFVIGRVSNCRVKLFLFVSIIVKN